MVEFLWKIILSNYWHVYAPADNSWEKGVHDKLEEYMISIIYFSRNDNTKPHAFRKLPYQTRFRKNAFLIPSKQEPIKCKILEVLCIRVS